MRRAAARNAGDATFLRSPLPSFLTRAEGQRGENEQTARLVPGRYKAHLPPLLPLSPRDGLQE